MKLVTNGSIVDMYNRKFRVSVTEAEPGIVRLICTTDPDINAKCRIEDLPDFMGFKYTEDPTECE